MTGLEIRVRGQVQGVGYRPAVWRLARELGLDGSVASDAQGVVIHAAGPPPALAAFLERLEREPPPLARVQAVEAAPITFALATGFQALEAPFAWRTLLEPDAAPCAECAREVRDPFSRRYRYPFTSCARCGPAFGLLLAPGRTSRAAFDRCPACAAEVADPSGRRFQAAATACHRCGPRARLVRLDGRAVSFEQHSMLDDVDAAASLLRKGEVLALKGPGGYQLLCDATRAGVVERLRAGTGRGDRPFALLARDLEVVRRHARVGEGEAAALEGPQAPVVLLAAQGRPLPAAVAPGLSTLGVQLPPTALHLLLVQGLDRPLVLASGNRSGEAPALGDEEARHSLGGLASHALVSELEVAGPAGEVVVQVAEGRARTLRRGRGQAPAPLPLPPGLEGAPALLALGGEQEAAFCLVRDGQAFLSCPLGALGGPGVLPQLERALDRHAALLEVAPAAVVGGAAPGPLAGGLLQARAAALGVPRLEVQHAHAHLAACLAENGRPASAPPVLGVVLEGLAPGEDGTWWGGEFLVGDYRSARRAGTFKPVAAPGGPREPWRDLRAHLLAELGWPALRLHFGDLALVQALHAREPQGPAPLASSCGRLLDAVAAALGVAPGTSSYEEEAALRLEALVDAEALAGEDEALAYPFTIPRLRASGLPYLEPLAMWNALLGDLTLDTPRGVMAARFYRGLGKAVAAMVRKLAAADGAVDTVALSGGCFASRVLLGEVLRRLEAAGLRVLTHARVPCGEGGLALGQGAVAAARLAETTRQAR